MGGEIATPGQSRLTRTIYHRDTEFTEKTWNGMTITEFFDSPGSRRLRTPHSLILVISLYPLCL
jgi:hypothetical protein